MVGRVHQIGSGTLLSTDADRQLASSGYVTFPAAFTGAELDELTARYDEAMAADCGPDYKVGSTTTRLSDLLCRSSAFAQVFLFPPLLAVCANFFNEPFKLSSLLARTLRAGTPAQALHADLPRHSRDAPLLGFILMIDAFREENGATRFVPGSQHFADLPANRMNDTDAAFPGEVLSVGEAGSLVVFNAATWHGHTANTTLQARRSIQGYFVRRSARAGFDFAARLPEAMQRSCDEITRYLLALDG